MRVLAIWGVTPLIIHTMTKPFTDFPMIRLLRRGIQRPLDFAVYESQFSSSYKGNPHGDSPGDIIGFSSELVADHLGIKMVIGDKKIG